MTTKIHYGNGCNPSLIKSYWIKQLDLKESNIKIASKPQKEKKAKYGTATLYLSDVLLRRVMDAILDYIKAIFSLFPRERICLLSRRSWVQKSFSEKTSEKIESPIGPVFHNFYIN